MGRCWTNVTLKLSDCNIATMTTVMDNNATSTSTVAFSGSVTWPSVVGTPSGLGWEIKFPTRVFVSNRTADLLCDYKFSGGTLANNYAWLTNRGISFPGMSCANLYVAASPVMMIFPMMAGAGPAYRGYNYFGFTNGLIPVIPAAIGKKLFCQAAWADSGNGSLKASIGTEVTISQLPPYTDYTNTKRLCCMNPYTTIIWKYNNYYYNPICKYN